MQTRCGDSLGERYEVPLFGNLENRSGEHNGTVTRNGKQVIFFTGCLMNIYRKATMITRHNYLLQGRKGVAGILFSIPGQQHDSDQKNNDFGQPCTTSSLFLKTEGFSIFD